MERVYFTNTYGFRNFITESEREELEKWALSLEDKMNFSIPMNNEQDQYEIDLRRHFLILKPEDEKPELFYKLKNKIIEIEHIKENIPAPINYDWVGIVGNGSYVEQHTDDNLDDEHYTVRYNLLISFPKNGGRPIYDGIPLDVEEKMLWRCDAGLIRHSSEIVKDDKHRINLSFGFSFKF